MKVLVATNETQGARENDFCWTVEGELVFIPPIECGRGYVDDNCGCRRSMAGMVSWRATTTVKVVEREDLDPTNYYTLVVDALESQGYVTKELGFDAFFTVTIPLAVRGLIAGCVLAFARSLGEFGATIMIAGNIEGETRTIPLAIFSLVNRPDGIEQSWRLVVISILLACVALAAGELIDRRQTERELA